MALLVLPPELDGLPYEDRADAFARAEAALPPDLAARLGQAVAEECLTAAAAHLLCGHQPASPSDAAGKWAGSVHGNQVAAILARMPRQSGRLRGPLIT